jgi:predicted O-methyltransferase YrrM
MKDTEEQLASLVIESVLADSPAPLAHWQESFQVPMDLAHVFKIIGEVYVRKPKAVLELGVGSGLLSAYLLKAIRHNSTGSLTCVDELGDFGVQKPKYFQHLHDAGAEVVIEGEANFLRECVNRNRRFNLIVADAEHFHDHEQPEDIMKPYLNVCEVGGVVFVHDVDNKTVFSDGRNFSNLSNGRKRVQDDPHKYGVAWCELFNLNSRPNEHCDRGLFMMVKRKP